MMVLSEKLLDMHREIRHDKHNIATERLQGCRLPYCPTRSDGRKRMADHTSSSETSATPLNLCGETAFQRISRFRSVPSFTPPFGYAIHNRASCLTACAAIGKNFCRSSIFLTKTCTKSNCPSGDPTSSTPSGNG